MNDDVEAYREILRQHLAACDHTVSTEILRGRMMKFCLPAGLSLYTTAGVLEQIAELIAEPTPVDEDEDEDEDTDHAV
jgi:hypothetical protein